MRNIKIPSGFFRMKNFLIAGAALFIIAGGITGTTIYSSAQKSRLASNNPAQPVKTEVLSDKIVVHDKNNIIALANKARHEKQLDALAEEAKLTASAQALAEKYAASAASVDSQVAGDNAQALGYTYELINVRSGGYYKNDDEFVNYMKSESNNITALFEAKYVHTGVGIAKIPNTNSSQIIMLFAQPGKSVATSTYKAAPQYTYTPPASSYSTYTPPSSTSYQSYKPYYCSTFSSDYSRAVSAENQRYSKKSAEINSAIAKVNMAGAGNSSAMDLLLRERGQNINQHQQILSSLQADYQAKSVECA